VPRHTESPSLRLTNFSATSVKPAGDKPCWIFNPHDPALSEEGAVQRRHASDVRRQACSHSHSAVAVSDNESVLSGQSGQIRKNTESLCVTFYRVDRDEEMDRGLQEGHPSI
jgi:hypothetical protein